MTESQARDVRDVLYVDHALRGGYSRLFCHTILQDQPEDAQRNELHHHADLNDGKEIKMRAVPLHAQGTPVEGGQLVISAALIVHVRVATPVASC
ncbi:MAG: hypothetical protein HUU01_01200 [Saprospiraceae bacterium]|nr:hypothetical protein [Anaerolineales bacterium]NUN99209.1 hypothetical protein [Saprospiraceae bacterium]